MDVKSKLKFIVFGASGLTGSVLLKKILDHGHPVLSVGRKSLQIDSPLLLQIDFDQFFNFQHNYPLADSQCYICIGTTMKKAGSKETFAAIDRDLVIRIASHCIQNGVKTIHYISAVGSNAKSPIFYSKIKGETEDILATLNPERIFIYRPSLLLGIRREFRFAEWISIRIYKFIGFIFGPWLGKYRPVDVDLLANAMYMASVQFIPPGTHYFYYSDFCRFSNVKK